MAKSTRKKTSKKKAPKPKSKSDRKLNRGQIFLLGVFVGLGLFLLPIDQEFSPAQFTQKKEWSDAHSIFSRHSPITAPIIKREGHILAYNGQTRNAHWVYHKLTPAILEKTATREDCEFKEDPLIPVHIRATKNDYLGTGFDRGHLCAAADCVTQQAMNDSFFLSNIAPQAPAFNRGYWKKLESHVRELTKQYQVVHAFSGPLYLGSKARDGKRYVKYQLIGKNDVAVPTHFFMLIFVELPTNKMLTKAYILPNKAIDAKTPLKKFSASVEEVESASGVMFTQILES